MSRKSCKNCGLDFTKSWSAYCTECDATFSFDGNSTQAVCTSCRQLSSAVFQDEAMEICKFCYEAFSPKDEESRSNEAKATASPAASGPLIGVELNHSERRSGHCEVGAQSNVQQPSEAIQRASESALTQTDELWRLIGCVCHNQEARRFKLVKWRRPTKSYFCLDCEQPYSAFLGDTELRWDQCPRCNGSRVETDRIDLGETAVVCMECKGRVSKRRYDMLLQAIMTRTEAERNTGVADEIKCKHCNSAEVKFSLTEQDGHPCLFQECMACESVDCLVSWDKEADQIEIRVETQGAAPGDNERAIPAGFEELARCCGDLASLHPVEDNEDDDLLICDRCDQTFSLRSCTDRRIPRSVSALRSALKGSFSTGKMGQPYRTVKVTDIKDIKPGDQLDMRRRFYSHHAIVDEASADGQQLSVIEYTGELNGPTIGALMRQLPSKACVMKSLLKFAGMKNCMYRVDYHSLDCFHPKTVLRRAADRVGEAQYHLVGSNCEHFSNWAKANSRVSRQVEKCKEVVRKELGHAVIQISDFLDQLPEDGPLKAAVEVLLGLRQEMLQAIDRQQDSASIRDFWCPVRLFIKWSFRRIPLAIFSQATAEFRCKVFFKMDGLLNRIGEKIGQVPKKILAIKDAEEEKELTKEKAKK